MKNQNSMQPDGVFRNSALITGRMRKSAHTYIAGAIGMAAVTAVDSLIAGIRIGESAQRRESERAYLHWLQGLPGRTKG